MLRRVERLCRIFALVSVVVAVLCAVRSEAWAKAQRQAAEPLKLEVEGHSDAFYYRPRVRGLRPVIMYLHGRGGNAMEDCRKWARVATQFGWVVCPQGPEDR